MKITKGKQKSNMRMVMYAPEGSGKSTFAAQFSKGIFMDVEGSTEDMDVQRVTPPTWGQVLNMLDQFSKDSQGFEHLIIDTADWCQRLAVENICMLNNWDTISQKNDYGYSYNLLGEAWGKFINKLTDVSKKMSVIVLCHSHLTKFESPEENGSYDRYSLKLICTPKYDMSAMLKEWAKMVLFVNYKTEVVEINKKKKAQGGKRVMYTTHTPYWDAKNRFNLPGEMPFEIKDGNHQGYESLQSCLGQKTEVPKEQFHSGSGLLPPEDAIIIQKPDDKEREKIEPGSEVIFEQVAGRMERPPPTQLKEDPTSFPAKLWDLMTMHGVTEEEIQKVVAQQGYYPVETPVGNYDAAFVDGRLIANWDAVYNEIKKIRG